VLFVKVTDVGPDGKARLIKGLEAPIRIPDVGNYRGGLTSVPVTIASGAGQTLVVPVV